MKNLWIVGLGPGGQDYRTGQAAEALRRAEVLCGYTRYVELAAQQFPGKTCYTTPMRGELERCRWALDTARSGKATAMVCSGDPGVYGMASPVLQLCAEADGAYDNVDIEIVPGVTAALSGAALLGAPLGNDFCVLSLSDLLTPWEQIARRLRAAADGDFTICIYNPSSNRRRDHLRRACDLLLAAGRTPDTVCGYVKNIGRDGTVSELCTLEQLRDTETDMFTTVFIGSSATRKLGNRMVTPRGYVLS